MHDFHDSRTLPSVLKTRKDHFFDRIRHIERRESLRYLECWSMRMSERAYFSPVGVVDRRSQ